MISSQYGHEKIVELLLEHKCKVCLCNSRRTTALHDAALAGQVPIAHMLVKAGALVNQQEIDGDTPLALACMKGHVGMVKMLLKIGCLVNTTNEMLRTPLREAAAQGNIAIVNMLINAKADLDVKEIEGDTALIASAMKGHSAIVRALITAGGDVTITNQWKRSALHEACSVRKGPVETVRLILNAGVCPDASDSMGNTPLSLATQNEHPSIVLELIRANCNVNLACQQDGGVAASRPIQSAVIKEAFTIAQMLYHAGCNMNDVNMVPVKNAEMKAWLETITSRPVSMKCTSRAVIRKTLGYRAESKISVLPLPNALLQYLMFSDLDQFALPMSASVLTEDASERDTDSGSGSEDTSSYPTSPT